MACLVVPMAFLVGCGEQSPGTIRIEKAEWVPGFLHNGWWAAVPDGASLETKQTVDAIDTSLELAPGHYDIYWSRGYEHASDPMLLASGVTVRSATETIVHADSGVMLDVADWVPQLKHNGWWGAVPGGGSVDDRVDWEKSDHALLLPGGNYDIYWVQSYEHAASPMRLFSGIQIEPHQMVALPVQSGIRLEAADWVPGLEHNGWWGAVRAGADPADRTDWTDEDQELMLPPGTYDVYRVLGYKHAATPVRLASNVTVKDSLVPVDAKSGVRLVLPDGVEFGHNGWWGVTLPENPAQERVAWVEVADQPLLVPPGTYDLYWRQAYDVQVMPIKSSVTIKAGELVEVPFTPVDS